MTMPESLSFRKQDDDGDNIQPGGGPTTLTSADEALKDAALRRLDQILSLNKDSQEAILCLLHDLRERKASVQQHQASLNDASETSRPGPSTPLEARPSKRQRTLSELGDPSDRTRAESEDGDRVQSENERDEGVRRLPSARSQAAPVPVLSQSLTVIGGASAAAAAPIAPGPTAPAAPAAPASATSARPTEVIELGFFAPFPGAGHAGRDILSGATRWSDADSEKLRRAVRNYCSFWLLREYGNFLSLILTASVSQRLWKTDWSRQPHLTLFRGIYSLADIPQVSTAELVEKVPDDQIDWDHIVFAYLRDKTIEDCQVQWRSWDHPNFARAPPSEEEVVELVEIAESGQYGDWVQIAQALSTTRSEAWAFRTYQLFLTAQHGPVDKQKWSAEEDARLRAAVDIVGHHDWQAVSALMGTGGAWRPDQQQHSHAQGRDARQCLHRWKAIDPALRRGRFTRAEDAALARAHARFGDKWARVAGWVVGRSDAQCREAWANRFAHVAAASGGDVVNADAAGGGNRAFAPWSEEENAQLLALVAQHGTKWSFLATLLPHSRPDHALRQQYSKLRTHIATGKRANPDNLELPVDRKTQRLIEKGTVQQSPADMTSPHVPTRPTLAALHKILTAFQHLSPDNNPLMELMLSSSANSQPATSSIGQILPVQPTSAGALSGQAADRNDGNPVASSAALDSLTPSERLQRRVGNVFATSALVGTVSGRPIGWRGAEYEEEKRRKIRQLREQLARMYEERGRNRPREASPAGIIGGTRRTGGVATRRQRRAPDNTGR